jgi:hypothetical protein
VPRLVLYLQMLYLQSAAPEGGAGFFIDFLQIVNRSIWLQRQNCRLLSKTKLSLATVVEKDTWCLDSEWSGYSVPQVPSETCTSSIYRYSVPWFRRKNRGLKYPYAYRWYANAYRWYGTWSIQTKICFLTKKPAYKIIPILHISMKIYVSINIYWQRGNLLRI